MIENHWLKKNNSGTETLRNWKIFNWTSQNNFIPEASSKHWAKFICGSRSTFFSAHSLRSNLNLWTNVDEKWLLVKIKANAKKLWCAVKIDATFGTAVGSVTTWLVPVPVLWLAGQYEKKNCIEQTASKQQPDSYIAHHLQKVSYLPFAMCNILGVTQRIISLTFI